MAKIRDSKISVIFSNASIPIWILPLQYRNRSPTYSADAQDSKSVGSTRFYQHLDSLMAKKWNWKIKPTGKKSWKSIKSRENICFSKMSKMTSCSLCRPPKTFQAPLDTPRSHFWHFWKKNIFPIFYRFSRFFAGRFFSSKFHFLAIRLSKCG